MDRVAVVKRLVEVQAVLSDLSCSENEVEAAVSRLREVLYYCVQYDVEGPGRNATFDMKIVKALLGILRSSSSMSLQVKVASCLALLVHENEEGRQRLGRIKNFFQLLVNLISPESSKLTSERELEKSVIPSWSISQADMYEQVLSILRKLTYLNSDNQIRLAQSGGIKLLVNLSMSDIFFRNSGYFCLESKRCLEELTLGKKLPCRAASIQNSSKGAVLSSFQALLGDNCVVTAQYPAFYVNLATDDKKWVSSVMIERGVVWPDHCSLPEEECKWTRVTVTCVEDGNNVWCKFCKEKLDTKMVEMQKSLDKMPPPLSGVAQDFPLTPGNVYAAYCDPAQLDSPSSLSSDQWCRVRLLRVLPDSTSASGHNRQVVVLAVDFGFMMTVPESHLALLPPQCSGLPPQAVPCRLLGVAPLPPKPSILENIAAILRNLAFDSYTSRSEIAAQNGIEALTKLCQCPNEGIAHHSVCALLNMSVSKSMRSEMGQRGVVDVLLNVCQRSPLSNDFLHQTLHCLLNLILECSENKARLLEAKGDKVLRNVLVRYKDNEDISRSVVTLMQHLPQVNEPTGAQLLEDGQSLEISNRSTSIKSTSSDRAEYQQASGSSISSSKSSLTTKFAKGAPTGETVFSQHKRCLSLPLTPSSPGLQSPGRSTTVPQSVSPPQRRMNGLVFSSRKTTNERSTTRSEPSPLARPTSYRKYLYEARRKFNGERVRQNPIYRCEGDADRRYRMEEGTSESETVSEVVEEIGEKEIECEASGSVAKNNCYLVNCALPGGLENATRSFIAVENITDVSRRLIKRTVCAMMNLGKTSTIYIGVLKDGTVKGVRLSRQQRDQFCVGVDGALQNFKPFLPPELRKIHFVPVAVQLNGDKRLAKVDDYFVIELTVLESPYRQVYTISERDCNGESIDRCYYRKSVSNDCLSCQELREIIALEVGESYLEKITYLESRLKDLKAKDCTI